MRPAAMIITNPRTYNHKALDFECHCTTGELEVREGRFRIRNLWHKDERIHADGRGVTCIVCGRKIRD